MDLKQKIIFERIERLTQLSPAEQEQVLADSELLALIEEHKELSQLEPTHGPAPNMDAVLSQVFTQAEHHKEPKMSLVTRIFTGKRWYAQAGLAAVLLMAAAVVFFATTSETSWAATDGYVLVFDFGNIGDIECDDENGAVQQKLKALEEPIFAWAEKRKAAAEKEGREPEANLGINVNIDNGELVAVVSLFGGTTEMAEELTAVLAKVPGLPTPTVTDATWFSENGMAGFSGGDGIDVTIFNHQFSFPKGVDSQTVETQINEWLAANKPELKAQVKITEEDGRIAIQIKLTEGDKK